MQASTADRVLNPQSGIPRRLEGKTIIVTGAGGGIGAAAARHFASHGAKVACADIDLDSAEDIARGLREGGGSALGVGVDVTSFADCERMADSTLAEFGRIDGIYANAGVHGAGSADAVDVEAWRRVIDINLTGSFLSVKAVLPAMLAQGSGSILLQASLTASNGIKGTASYSASKAGLLGLGKQMAVEYASRGIRVNCISPATTRTALVEALYNERAAANGSDPEADLARTAAGYPMGRLATIEEIARTALYLLSDDASFVTGVNIPVDGGFTAS